MTWMDTAAVADYLSISRDSVRRLVRKGRIPKPSRELGPKLPRWDKSALDSAMSGIHDIKKSVTQEGEEIVQKLRSQSRASRKAPTRRRQH